MSLTREQYRARRAANLCVQCKAPTSGTAMCPGCADANAKRLRDLRAERTAERICITCTAPVDGRHTQCSGCIEALADRMRDLYRRRRAPDAAPLPTAIVVQRRAA